MRARRFLERAWMAEKVSGQPERVVLVDRMDRELGSEEKLRAHQTGALHRAFSVFVFDRQWRVLLQRRADGKYHSPGLWSNTCCGHPRPGERLEDAAVRRLEEEMGFACPLRRAFSFVYRADLEGGLVEHELDHVFIGSHDDEPTPDPAEVSSWRWAGLDELQEDVRRNPERYTAWLPTALSGVLEAVPGDARMPCDWD